MAAGWLAAAAALVAACGGEEAAGPAEAASQAVPVEVAVVQRDALVIVVESVGSLEADSLVEIRPEAAGTVAAIPVEEGEQVGRGEVLVRLDARELSAEVAAVEAAVARARTEVVSLERRVERNRGLFDKGAISRQTLDDLESSYEAAAARLAEAAAQRDVARRRLDKAVIRAPFAGRTGARSVYAGDYVQEGDRLFTLVDDDPLKVEFTVSEQYVDRLAPGSPVALRVRSLPGREFTGRVVFISPQVDRATRTVTLKAEVPNPGGELRAGQFADVALELERRADAVVVPEQAIVPRGGENFLFVVAGGKVEERRVVLGQRQTGTVEVREGVVPGERVVLAGQQRLREGSEVSIVGEAGGVAAAEGG